MEKITDKIAALPSGSSYFSLEFFPPKTDMGASNLRVRLDRMSRALRPLFVTVTWGAGGSTATKSLELAEVCQRELGLTTCLHLTCTNMSQALVDRALEDAKALGVRNILALRGDPPRNEEYEIVDPREPVAKKDAVQFEWAIDLVRYIRQQYGDYFCIGVAAYPEGHADESHPLGQSLEHDLPYLVEKVKAGADFIMTQLFFDIAAYDKFERTLREHSSGVFKNLPIIPGMMPIQSYQMIRRTTKLSHAALPSDIMTRLDEVKGDDEMVKKVGVDILCEIVDHLKGSPVSTPSPRGFHFYTLNLEKAVSHILERTSLIPPEEEFESAILDPVPSLLRPISPAKTSQGRLARRQSSIGSDPHNRIIISGPTSNNPDFEATANEAGIRAESVNTRANTLAISEGEGSLGREATWDDFPNGRWGDARSPAYGEIDGYGVSLHVSITSALRLWGLPTSVAEITQLFIQHIEGTIKAIPWSEEAFNEETNIIKPELLALNRKGWWTVASQPAVNGVRSSDPIFGWGPKNGYVFQKAFVELFLPSADWEILLKKLQRPGVAEYVSFYASNNRSYISSDEEDSETDAASQKPSNQPGRPSTNAVTWGAFPGKEIITPTIIERESFRAWCEEAYEIWAEWGRVYSVKGEKGLETKAVIDGVAKDVWLINIIHHGYQEPNGLWDLLLKEQQNGH